MPSNRPSDYRSAPIFDHYHKLGALLSRARNEATRHEALEELDRYYDEGLIAQKIKEAKMAEKRKSGMTQSGYCAHPSSNRDSHQLCKEEYCTCDCHDRERVFSGQGIIFAVIDDREQMRTGKVSTVDVITEAIDAALDAGHETSEDIARYITTSAFHHVRDQRVRFNSVLKAGDIVGAQITRKLYNSYNDLAQMADEEDDPKAKAALQDEARGFAEAIQVVMSPFSCEDAKDPRLVNWDEVDYMTELFEKEQRAIRKERDGEPQ